MYDQYRAAKDRHSLVRQHVYAATREDAIIHQGLGSALRLDDIDATALEAWEETWAGRSHGIEAGGWNWPRLVRALPTRAAILPLAIWFGSDLCGLALGRLSRHRASGVRHTVSLTHTERRPEPPDVPLRGRIIPLAIAAARNYGVAFGATRLRLEYPDRNLLWYYELLGFDVAWRAGKPVYCEREI